MSRISYLLINKKSKTNGIGIPIKKSKILIINKNNIGILEKKISSINPTLKKLIKSKANK